MTDPKKSRRETLQEMAAAIKRPNNPPQWLKDAVANELLKLGNLGRPAGRDTSQQTPSYKRAEAYLILIADGTTKAAAAKKVSDEWQVALNTIYQDAKRHINRITENQTAAAGVAMDNFLIQLTHFYVNKYLIAKSKSHNKDKFEQEADDIGFNLMKDMVTAIVTASGTKEAYERLGIDPASYAEEICDKDQLIRCGRSIFKIIEFNMPKV